MASFSHWSLFLSLLPSIPFLFCSAKSLPIHANLKILPFSSKLGLQIVKICNNILVEDGFAEFASSRELVRKCIAFRFARISSRYAGGLRESGNHATDPWLQSTETLSSTFQLLIVETNTTSVIALSRTRDYIAIPQQLLYIKAQDSVFKRIALLPWLLEKGYCTLLFG